MKPNAALTASAAGRASVMSSSLAATSVQGLPAAGTNGTPGAGTTEFSRLLARSQDAATADRRAASAATALKSPTVPSATSNSSPRPTPAEPARPADAAASKPEPADPSEAVADGSASPLAPAPMHSGRPAVRARPAESANERHAVRRDAACADSAAKPGPDAVDSKDRGQAADLPATDLASVPGWGALPVPAPAPTPVPALPVVPPGTAAPTAEADTSDTPSRITAFQRDGDGPASAEIRARADLGEAVEPTAADAASAALTAARDATDRLTERGAAAGAEPGTASFPIDARPLAGATPDPALAMLAVLSGGVRADAERKTRHADDSLPTAGLAVGALGAAAQMRSIDAPTPPSATASVSTPLTDADFHEALGLQVSLLARDGIQQAELRLNPADMGPVSVQITMNGDQARVDFGADLAQTRQIIEAGWAELAASLQEAGFTLSGGGVSEHARNRQEPVEFSSRGADRRATAEDAPVVAVVLAARPRAGAALDLYA